MTESNKRIYIDVPGALQAIENFTDVLESLPDPVGGSDKSLIKETDLERFNEARRRLAAELSTLVYRWEII